MVNCDRVLVNKLAEINNNCYIVGLSAKLKAGWKKRKGCENFLQFPPCL
jgi:hypothetical protein